MFGARHLYLAPLLLLASCFQDGPEGTATTSTTSSATSSTTTPSSSTTDAPTTTGATTTDTPTTGADDTSDTGESSTTGPACMTLWYRDVDQDGHGNPAVTKMACMRPAGHVPLGDDCDDMDSSRAPGLTEVCDDVDNDCDGLIDEHSPQNILCKQCTLIARGEHSYAFCTFARTWSQARAECQQRSGDLAVIDDADENAALAAQGTNTPGALGSWYIGLSDLALEGSFVWLDGIPAVFTSWNLGEPNNVGGLENCAVLPNTGLWNDEPCDDPPKHFICETPAP